MKRTLITCLVLIVLVAITVPVFAMGKPVVRSVPDGAVELVSWNENTDQPYLTETPEGMALPSLDYLPKDAAIMANFLPAWGKGELDYVELRKDGKTLWKRNKPPFNQLIKIKSDTAGIYHGIEYVEVLRDKTNNAFTEKYRIVDQMVQAKQDVNPAPAPPVVEPSAFIPYTGNKVIQIGQEVTYWINKKPAGSSTIVNIDRNGFYVAGELPAGKFFFNIGAK